MIYIPSTRGDFIFEKNSPHPAAKGGVYRVGGGGGRRTALIFENSHLSCRSTILVRLKDMIAAGSRSYKNGVIPTPTLPGILRSSLKSKIYPPAIHKGLKTGKMF